MMGGQQCPEGAEQHRAEALRVELIHHLADGGLVLAVALAVEDGVADENGGDHEAGDDTGDKQRADRRAGGLAVEDEGNGGRDDDPQAAGHGHQRHGELLVVAHLQHDGDGHGPHRRHGGGGGAGDGPEEQTGDDHRAGNTGGAVADEVGEHVKQPLGHAAPGHDEAGEDEQRNGQQGGLVDAAHHGPEDVHAGDGDGGGEQAGEHTAHGHGDAHRDGQAQQHHKDEDDQRCHASPPPFTARRRFSTQAWHTRTSSSRKPTSGEDWMQYMGMWRAELVAPLAMACRT